MSVSEAGTDSTDVGVGIPVLTTGLGLVPLRLIEYGVYGDLTITDPEPCSIYVRGTIRVYTTWEQKAAA